MKLSLTFLLLLAFTTSLCLADGNDERGRGSGNDDHGGDNNGRRRQPRVLMIVSSATSWIPTTGPLPGISKGTGMWLAEFTHSWTVFNNSGFRIDVASPLGGNAKPDPQGFVFYRNDPRTQPLVIFNQADIFNSRLPLTENTLKTSDVNPSLYDAVFFVGGTGAMFDYIFDPAIPTIVRTLWESNKIVGAVCHGPIALTTVVLSNGKHLVDGKLMTAFSNDEELALGNANECVFCYQGIAAYAGPACNLSNPFACYGPNMPAEYSVPRTPLTGTPDPSGKPTCLIETKLKALGAKYVATYQNWNNFYFRPHVVRDGRLVTGQNPGAGWETALKVVEAVRDSLHEPDRNTDNVLESQFCSAIQQAPTDPPVVCSTAGGLCRA